MLLQAPQVGAVVPPLVAQRKAHRPSVGALSQAANNCPSHARAQPAAQPLRAETRKRGGVRLGATKKTYPSFDALVAESEVPVLVDFYATWCGPCQLLAPILGQVAKDAGDKLTVVKINTETYPQLASKFEINALPTIILFKNGVVVDRIEGLPTLPQLLLRVRQFL